METLSTKQTEFLQAVHERGLVVLYRFLTASPYWLDTKTPLTDDEWDVQRSLWRSTASARQFKPPILEPTEYYHEYIKDGFKHVSEGLLIDGQYVELSHRRDSLDESTPDQLIAYEVIRSVEHTPVYTMFGSGGAESDFLDKTFVKDLGDDGDLGTVYRMTVRPDALALIGIGWKG